MTRAVIWTTIVLALITAWPTAGTARTLQILQQSQNVFKDSGGQGGSITGQVSHYFNGSQQTNMLAAGAFQLRERVEGSTGEYEAFIGFCIEITTSLKTRVDRVATYTEDSSLLSPLRRTLIATLYQEVWDPTGSVLHQGAFQLALWKLAHGDVSSAGADGFVLTDTTDLGVGTLSFTQTASGYTSSKTFDHYTPGVFAQAQEWLDKLDGQGTDWALKGAVSDYALFLHSEDGQDLVRAARAGIIGAPPPAIPVPPAVVMTGGALGVLAWARRRRMRVARASVS